MGRDRIRIANCGGFWGDDPTAARRQVEGGPVDYLVMDYLAEVTMAILQKQRQDRPDAGFAADFLVQLRDVLPACVERGIRVISNAGGVNPLACRAAVEALAAELGVADRVKVAVVIGDDLYDDLDAILGAGEELANLDTGRPIADIRTDVLSANVYLGAAPVVQALELGANVIIAGRVTDTAITLAPMIWEFGWAPDDWDRVAAGIVAGHIIECGTQTTGGNFTDWRTVPSFSNIGYPIIEADADGTFVVTKHDGTGGLVNVHTVSEQLLYEMGTPEYLSPDCIAHFDSVQLAQEGPDRVRITGVRGSPPPERLKVSVSFAHGYRIFGRIMVTGPEALDKARLAADVFWESAGGVDAFEETNTQLIGWNATHPSLTTAEPSEVLVQVAARDQDRKRLDAMFGANIVSRGLGSIPGFCAPADQGRPRASSVVGYWPALVSRDQIAVHVVCGDEDRAVSTASPTSTGTFTAPETPAVPVPSGGATVTVPLSRLCLARSGDKGDTCNIGVVARSPEIYAWMRGALTEAAVKDRFATLARGDVERHEFPNLLAVNFLLHESLGGGGTRSIRFDAQGKTYAQYLLAAEVDVDEALLATIAP